MIFDVDATFEPSDLNCRFFRLVVHDARENRDDNRDKKSGRAKP